MMFSHLRSYRLAMLRSLAFAALLALPLSAHAVVPGTMNVQGSLFTLSGGAVADGNYNVTFSIYKDAVGGNPVYTEGPVLLAFKNGVYSYAVGSKTPLTAAALSGLSVAFLGMKVEADPEFPRQSMASVPFALHAAQADGLDCSGCIGAAQLDATLLGSLAKSAALAKVATSGAYADLTGGPDLSAYTKTVGLAKVATSGAFADLSGGPDLSGYAKTASLATVATSGKYKDLVGVPVAVALGSSCGTGLFVQGVKADGSLDCVSPNAGLPSNGLGTVSNGLVVNEFAESISGTKDIPIPDASPVGVSDTLIFPDIGVAETFAISIDLTNSDLSTLSVSVFDPNAKEYVLHNGGAPGTAIKTSFPDLTATISGDLTSWIGKNPKGKWYLKVVDSGLLNNASDGKVSWSINLKCLSNKKISVNGSLNVSGDVGVGGNSVFTGDVTFKGKVIGLANAATYRWAVWSTYDQWQGTWMDGDDPALFGGIAPSQWSDGAAHAAGISADKEVQSALFGKKGYARKNSAVWHEQWRSYSSTNGRLAGALFRVRNNTSADLKWTIDFHYSSYSGWSEIASVALNGEDTWASADDCGGTCNKVLELTIPKNRVSTVIVVSASSPESGEMRNLTLGFHNDCLKLPDGLEFIDDLDTATGGYEQ